MALNIQLPENNIIRPNITVLGVGGAGGNATNNMIKENLECVNFVVANTDAQALSHSLSDKKIQLGQKTTQGLGAGATPSVGHDSAEEAIEEIIDHLKGSNMVFITAGMGGGTGTGAAPVIARAAREAGILTVGVVTKPFHFEGPRRMKTAEAGLEEMQKHVDTLIVIPNQNLFRIANEKTTFADAFNLADDVLYAGVRGITDLMVMPGLINLDFADVKSVMSEMGKAMMGTGEAEGENRAKESAEAAISNPLLDNVSMKGARGVLINITGGADMTLFEVDEAANRIREEVDPSANIIFGSTFSDDMQGKMRVSVVATGIDAAPKNAINTESTPAVQEEVGTPIIEETTTQETEDEAVSKEDFQEAINNLNDEYAELENNIKSEPFIAPEPIDPESIETIGEIKKSIEQDINSLEQIETAAEKQQKSSGGIFSRVARAARSFQQKKQAESFLEEEIEEQVQEQQPQKELEMATTVKDEEEMLDIPAFLRRKV